MYQDVKFIEGRLYYEEKDGKWYPLSLLTGGGSRGAKGATGAAGPTGATGATGSSGVSFEAAIDSPDGLTLTAIPIGGVAPYTYTWGVKSKFINGTDISFSGPTNAVVATINNAPASFDGTVAVAIVDSAGSVAFAYWHTRKDSVP